MPCDLNIVAFRDGDGREIATEMLRSTGYPAWDEAIRNAMLACAIRPAAAGPAGPVCAKIPFTYQR